MTQASLALDLAELSRERHDHIEAVRGYTQALRDLAPEDARRRLVALRGRASSLYRLGRADDSLADSSAARVLAQAVGDAEAEAEILLERATALDWSHDVAGSRAAVDEAEALVKSAHVTARIVRTGILVGRGRTLLRQGNWAGSCATLELAVGEAEQLGHPGYEPLVVALLLLMAVLPHLGRTSDASQVAERVIALTKAKGDRLNLASALNNRRNLLVANGDLAAAIADQEQFRELGKEIGLVVSEYIAEYNLAELLYQSGDIAGAAPHALRAISFESAHPELASRPLAALLQARLFTFQGLLEEARRLLQEVEAAVQQARQQGRDNGLLAPSEEVLARMVDLSTRDASEAEWNTLVERSSRDSIEQEPIEVVEMRALSAMRRGRGEEARRCFASALSLAARIPNLMSPRLLKGREAASA